MNTTGQQADAKPTIVLVHGAFADASSWNGVIGRLQRQGAYAAKFSGTYAHRTVSGGIGHNLQEAPQAFAQAIIDVAGQR